MDLQQLVEMLVPVVKDVIAGSLTVSDSGVIGGAREAGAIATSLKEAAAAHGDNPIIAALVPHLFDEDNTVQIPDLNTLDITNLFASIGNAAAVLNTIQGGDQVKQMIYSVAERVAQASGGGLFGGGQKVNASEEQYLAGLKAQLGLQ